MNRRKFLQQHSEFLIYQVKGRPRIEVKLYNDTVWLSLKQMAELFQRDKSVISRHISNVFKEGELARDAVVAKFATTAVDGKQYQVDYYNLDMIISVGYRVKSLIATRFRIWATQRLKEYIIKGFVLNDERLKNPPAASAEPDYFDEMLERIRDIRASERRMYLRVREIFAMAADYEPSLPETAKFFSIIQNKLHYAATGMTAAELIKNRADYLRPNMGLTNWKGDDIRRTDVTVAKNYLNENEISELNRIVVMWLDFAEDQAKRRKQVFLKDWEQKLDEFLRFNDRKVLPCAGKVSKQDAEDYAATEYEKFAVRRRKNNEKLGESDYLKQLEQAAKMLPKKMRRRGK